MEPITAKGTLRAWSTNKWTRMDEIANMITDGNSDHALKSMHYTTCDMSESPDWVEVGTAEVVVTLFPREEVASKELEGLRAQLQKVRAENHVRENAILDRISKLQAITYDYEPQE